MPAQKPSPHRFIAPNLPSAQTPKPKPKSSLRHAISARTPKANSELQLKKATPAKRFVVAPPQRLAGDATPRPPDRVEEPDSSASTDYTPRPKAQRKLERVESIEDASQSSPARPTEEELDVLQTIEHESMFVDDEDEAPTLQDDEEILFPSAPRPKRRRSSSPTPHTSHPEPPTTPIVPPPHRFRFPAQTPSTTPTTSTSTPLATTHSTHSTRPSFLLPPPPTSPQAPSRPLPELFSPSRKTHKYLPHGLASTVQTWIIEAASQSRSGAGPVRGRATATAPTSETQRERERGDDVRLRVLIEHLPGGERERECFPGGTVIARGQTEAGMYNASRAGDAAEGEGESVGLLLAGQGGRGAGGVLLRVGSVIGVRAPTWDVDVGGEKWVVGVDWVVL